MKILSTLFDLAVKAIALVKGTASSAGNTTATVVSTAIETVGGRKMFLALLTMVYVPLCFSVLKMPTELVLAGLGPLLAFIGVEGAKDVKTAMKG